MPLLYVIYVHVPTTILCLVVGVNALERRFIELNFEAVVLHLYPFFFVDGCTTLFSHSALDETNFLFPRGVGLNDLEAKFHALQASSFFPCSCMGLCGKLGGCMDCGEPYGHMVALEGTHAIIVDDLYFLLPAASSSCI